MHFQKAIKKIWPWKLFFFHLIDFMFGLRRQMFLLVLTIFIFSVFLSMTITFVYLTKLGKELFRFVFSSSDWNENFFHLYFLIFIELIFRFKVFPSMFFLLIKRVGTILNFNRKEVFLLCGEAGSKCWELVLIQLIRCFEGLRRKFDLVGEKRGLEWRKVGTKATLSYKKLLVDDAAGRKKAGRISRWNSVKVCKQTWANEVLFSIHSSKIDALRAFRNKYWINELVYEFCNKKKRVWKRRMTIRI
jgi:hypothetical protein